MVNGYHINDYAEDKLGDCFTHVCEYSNKYIGDGLREVKFYLLPGKHLHWYSLATLGMASLVVGAASGIALACESRWTRHYFADDTGEHLSEDMTEARSILSERKAEAERQAREKRAREREARERTEREEAAEKKAAKEKAAKKQAKREQEAREQRAREKEDLDRELRAKRRKAREQAEKKATAEEKEAREIAEKEKQNRKKATREKNVEDESDMERRVKKRAERKEVDQEQDSQESVGKEKKERSKAARKKETKDQTKANKKQSFGEIHSPEVLLDSLHTQENTNLLDAIRLSLGDLKVLANNLHRQGREHLNDGLEIINDVDADTDDREEANVHFSSALDRFQQAMRVQVLDDIRASLEELIAACRRNNNIDTINQCIQTLEAYFQGTRHHHDLANPTLDPVNSADLNETDFLSRVQQTTFNDS